MATYRTDDFKYLFEKVEKLVRKQLPNQDIKTSTFYEEMAKYIEGCTGVNIKSSTLQSHYRPLSRSQEPTVNIAESIYHSFHHIVHGEDASKPDPIQTGGKFYAHIFHKKLKKAFGVILDSEDIQTQNPFSFIANRYGVSQYDVLKIIAFDPTVLFSIIDKEAYSNKYNTGIQTHSYKTPAKELKNYEGLLLTHALSPYSENLGLILELGRFLRIATTLGFRRKEKREQCMVMLTGRRWCQHNWVCQDFGVQADDLIPAVQFRRKLYQKLKLNIKEVDFNNIKKLTPKLKKELDHDLTINEIELIAMALEYSDFAKFMFGDLDVDKDQKLSPSEQKAVLQFINNMKNGKTSLGASDIEKFFSNRLVRDSNEHHYTILDTVANHLKKFDVNSFKYFLLQRYSQLFFNNFLKISIKREQNFDIPFAELNQMEKINGYELHGMYFNDYHFDKDKNKVHPYYFPSGSLYTRYPKPIDFEQRAILIFDVLDAQRVKKIKSLIHEMDSAQLAIIMGDLFSFIQHFFTGNQEFQEAFKPLIKPLGIEFMASWRKYTNNKREDTFEVELDRFMGLWLTPWYEKATVPYYFFPYIFTLPDSQAELERSLDGHTLRTVYFNIIVFTLTNVIEQLKVKEWKVYKPV